MTDLSEEILARLRELVASLDAGALDMATLEPANEAIAKLIAIEAERQAAAKAENEERLKQLSPRLEPIRDALEGSQGLDTDSVRSALATRDTGAVRTWLDQLEDAISAAEEALKARDAARRTLDEANRAGRFAELSFLGKTVEEKHRVLEEAAERIRMVLNDVQSGHTLPSDDGHEEPEPEPEPSPDVSGVGTEPLDGGDVRQLEPIAETAPSAEVGKDEAAILADVTAEEEEPAPVGRISVLDDAVWSCLGEGRFGLAYHLARARDAAETFTTPTLSPRIIELVAANFLRGGVHVSGADGQDDGQRLVQELREATPVNRRHAILLIAGAAAIRPKLLDQDSFATAILYELAASRSGLPSLPAFFDVVEAIARPAGGPMVLNPVLLAGVTEVRDWQRTLGDLRKEVETWLQEQLSTTVLYAPATAVWHDWVSKDGWVGEALSIVSRDDGAGRPQVEKRLADWSSEFERELDRTDRALRKRGAKRKPIEARAKAKLKEDVRAAGRFAQRWLELLASKPRQSDDYGVKEASALRRKVRETLPDVRRELEEFGQSDDTAASIAASTTLRLLDRFAELFERVDIRKEDAPTWSDVLTHDLASAEIGFDAGGDGDARGLEDAQWPERLLRLAAAGEPDWNKIIEHHIAEEDHVSAGIVLEYLERRKELSESNLKRLRKKHFERLEYGRNRITSKIDTARDQVGEALAQDLISQSEFSTLQARLVAVDPTALEDFAGVNSTLQDIEDQIEEVRQQRAAKARERLKESKLAESDTDTFRRIEQVLEKGLFQIAEDYMGRAERGEVLPSETVAKPDVFQEFFPGFVDAVTATDQSGAGRIQFSSILRELSADRAWGPVSLTHIEKPHRKERLGMLETWHHVKTSRQQGLRALVGLFGAMGFSDVNLAASRTARPTAQEALLQLQCSPIADRDILPIPDYGSYARGHYRVLCLWQKRSEESILEAVNRAGDDGPPILVLFFGQLSSERRRSLAIQARRRTSRFLVLDEILLLYLAARGEGRLGRFFACSLPFAAAEPFALTPGYVPPEMFYGRQNERHALVATSGNQTNLVYGGRELGKTALLRQIEADCRNSPDILVRVVDLKVQRVGLGRPVNKIWAVISDELVKAEIPLGRGARRSAVERGVTEWLNKNSQRRILLLLDEADAFLEGDAKGERAKPQTAYENVSALKDLMENTHRRFKVVFAGLHDVQRASRDPNTPIAHLGEPVSVGALLMGTDLREAELLVKRPFEALGYAFETEHVITRILVHTNYCPSLIQLFCRELLRYLVSDVAGRGTGGDLNRITMGHVEEVFTSRRLGELVRDRFDLTIRLDPRYQVLALLICSLGKDDDEILINGLDVETIRDFAVSDWPQGFEIDSSIAGFTNILDEMVGLGVLREVEPLTYALRDSNVIHLLGTKAEVDNRYADAIREEPPATYEPA